MKPLNKAERQRSFLRFLLLYILTSALLLMGVFFGLRLPFRDNNKLKEKLAKHEAAFDFQKDFIVRSREISRLLDTVNAAGVQPERYEGQAGKGIADLSAMITTADSAAQPLYQLMVKNFSDLMLAKKQIRAGNNSDLTIQDCQRQLQAAQQEVNNLNNRITMMQVAAGQQAPR